MHGSRSRKTMRAEFEGFDEPTVLNEDGIFHLFEGNTVRAIEQFKKALVRVGGSKRLVHALDADEVLLEQEYDTTRRKGPLHAHLVLPSNEKLVEDDGMQFYTNPLPLLESHDDEYRMAIVLYNLGQSSLRIRAFSDAENWFMDSLHLVAKRGVVRRSRCPPTDSSLLLNTMMVYHNLGFSCYRLKKMKEALSYYHRAARHAKTYGFGQVDLAACYNCMGVLHCYSETEALSESGEKEGTVLQYFKEAARIYQTILGSATMKLAIVLENLVRYHETRCEYFEALKQLREAMAIRQHVIQGTSLMSTGTTLALERNGRDDVTMQKSRKRLNATMTEVLDFYTSVLQTVKAKIGWKHGEVVATMLSLVRLGIDTGNVSRAKKQLSDLLLCEDEIVSSMKCAQDRANFLCDIGHICFRLGENEGATHHYCEGVRLLRQGNNDNAVDDQDSTTKTDNHPQIMIALINLSQVLRQRGKPQEALKVTKEALHMQLKIFGPNSLEVASIQMNVGLLEYELEQYCPALLCYQNGLEVLRAIASQPRMINLGIQRDIEFALNSIGLIFLKLRNFHESLSAFSECLALKSKRLGPLNRSVAITWFNIASVWVEMGDYDEAIAAFQNSLRLEIDPNGKYHPEACITLQCLGQLYQRSGQLEHAIEHFGEAVEVMKSSGNEGGPIVFKLLNILGILHLMKANIPAMMECFADAIALRSQICNSGKSQNSNEVCMLIVDGYKFYELSKLYPPAASMA